MAHQPLLPKTEFIRLPIPEISQLPETYQYSEDIPVAARREYVQSITQTFPRQQS